MCVDECSLRATGRREGIHHEIAKRRLPRALDALADYNGNRNLASNAVNAETRERYRQIVEGYSPEFVAYMKQLQEEYDTTMVLRR